VECSSVGIGRCAHVGSGVGVEYIVCQGGPAGHGCERTVQLGEPARGMGINARRNRVECTSTVLWGLIWYAFAAVSWSG
jgi:hypothetical protein